MSVQPGDPAPDFDLPSDGGGHVRLADFKGRKLVLSNLDKVLYPAAGFTKAQVLDYYQQIAAVLQRLLAHPETLEQIGTIGKEIIAANRGSVAKLLALIEPWLPGAELQTSEAARAYR